MGCAPITVDLSPLRVTADMGALCVTVAACFGPPLPVVLAMLSTETDAALALGRMKARTVGQAAESCTAVRLTARKLRGVGRSDEADAGFALSASSGLGVGRADEVDTAIASAVSKLRSVGRTDETDSVLARAVAKVRSAGRSDDTASAFARAAVKLHAVGRADEADASLARSIVKSLAVSRAEESDAALARSSAKLRGAGRADENETALARTKLKIRAVGRGDETDTALALGVASGGYTVADFVADMDAAATWTAYYVCEPEYLTLSGSEITGWEDASGNGYDLTPAGTGPTFSATGSASGRGLASPSGSTGRMLKTGTPNISGTRSSIFCVGRPNTGQYGFLTLVGVTLGAGSSKVTATVNGGGTGFSQANSASDGSEHCYFSGMRASPHTTFEVDGAETTTVDSGTATQGSSYTNLHVMTDGFLNQPGYPTSLLAYALTEFTTGTVAAVETAINAFFETTFS